MNNILWLEAKYVNLLSFRLRNFKRKSVNTWNASCPFCGDSKKVKSKARGYIFESKGSLIYYCHKCGVSKKIPQLIQHLDQSLYNDFIAERFSETGSKQHQQFESSKPVFKPRDITVGLIDISTLPDTNPVKKYVTDRKIPVSFHSKLFICKKFKEWVNTIIPDKFEDVSIDEPRLIIPFYNKDGQVFGFQGRSFNKKSKTRYITIMLDDSPKIYGLDSLNKNKDIFVVEGPIDSLFLPNCIASVGGVLTSNLESVSGNMSKFVVVYDNEPRSKETVKKIEKSISIGYRVCIWPESVAEKDINDMVLAGKDPAKIIINNTYSGLEANLKLSLWRKV